VGISVIDADIAILVDKEASIGVTIARSGPELYTALVRKEVGYTIVTKL